METAVDQASHHHRVAGAIEGLVEEGTRDRDDDFCRWRGGFGEDAVCGDFIPLRPIQPIETCAGTLRGRSDPHACEAGTLPDQHLGSCRERNVQVSRRVGGSRQVRGRLRRHEHLGAHQGFSGSAIEDRNPVLVRFEAGDDHQRPFHLQGFADFQVVGRHRLAGVVVEHVHGGRIAWGQLWLWLAGDPLVGDRRAEFQVGASQRAAHGIEIDPVGPAGAGPRGLPDPPAGQWREGRLVGGEGVGGGGQDLKIERVHGCRLDRVGLGDLRRDHGAGDGKHQGGVGMEERFARRESSYRGQQGGNLDERHRACSGNKEITYQGQI